MDNELTISVSPEPGYVAVSVAGEIDMATAAQFREQLASVISGGAQRVVVDLARVTFMASAGVAVLMGTHRVLAGQSGSLVLASPSPAAGRVLSLAGVDQVIPVTGSVADAAARWASEGVELPETALFNLSLFLSATDRLQPSTTRAMPGPLRPARRPGSCLGSPAGSVFAGARTGWSRFVPSLPSLPVAGRPTD